MKVDAGDLASASDTPSGLTPAKRLADDALGVEVQGVIATGVDREVASLLEGIGLSRYAANLQASCYTSMAKLATMSQEDMRNKVGMLPGHVRVLQKYLRILQGGKATAGGLGVGGGSSSPGAGSSPVDVREFVQRATVEFRELCLQDSKEKQETRTQVFAAPPQAELSDDAEYLEALEAARRKADADPIPAGQDDTLFAMAHLAEESAQLVATALSFCSLPQADALQLAAVVNAAQQAAQRASWAAVSAVACADSPDYEKEWSAKMRRTAVEAAEVAEKSARDCAVAAAQASKTTVMSRVFCKFYTENRCLKGKQCEFSHDPAVMPQFAKAGKTELECVWAKSGHCNRGASCPYAHGPEELAEVLRAKQAGLTQLPIR